jgi:hypothetical protein
MSIATLKKKTIYKYNNSSVGHTQFSLNGGYRNQGFVGQTSLSRSLIKTPMKGNIIRGHGGIDGTYLQQANFTSDVISLNDSSYNKSSVISTESMIKQKNRWIRRPLPFSVLKPKKIDSLQFDIVKDKIVDTCSKIKIINSNNLIESEIPIINCRTNLGKTRYIECRTKVGTTSIGTKLSNGITCA